MLDIIDPWIVTRKVLNHWHQSIEAVGLFDIETGVVQAGGELSRHSAAFGGICDDKTFVPDRPNETNILNSALLVHPVKFSIRSCWIGHTSEI